MELEVIWPLLLLPLPLLVYRWVPVAANQSAALRVPFYRELEAISSTTIRAARPRLLKLLALAIIWVALLVAACRPVIIGDPVRLATSARDMLIAVDISGSMDERDMQLKGRAVTRIQTVKQVLGNFIERRAGDRLGLVLFADHAYTQAPLTYDTHTVKQLLNEAQLGFAGQKTAIGDAIGLSIKRLLERPDESRTLILLTDGANNAGNVSPLEAAALASENAIKIYTIGIGAASVVDRGFFGNSIRRNPSRDLDEKTLKDIATQTGGQYFRATSTQELDRIYAELDKLEPVEQQEQTFRPRKQLFYIPLSVALAVASLLLLSQLLLGHLAYRDRISYQMKQPATRGK